jgi:hypothetical protein
MCRLVIKWSALVSVVVFSKGLPIGEVTMVKKGEYGIFQTVTIRPFVSTANILRRCWWFCVPLKIKCERDMTGFYKGAALVLGIVLLQTSVLPLYLMSLYKPDLLLILMVFLALRAPVSTSLPAAYGLGSA